MAVAKMCPIHVSSQLTVHLKSIRKLRGWTQTELGQRVNVKQVRIAEIEGNPGVVSVDQMLHVIQAMGFDVCIVERKTRKESANEW